MEARITAVPPSSSNPVDRGNLTGRLASWHALAAIVFLSWRFGGMEPGARLIAACWCLAAPAITWFAWRRAERRLRIRFLRIALPLAALAFVVLVSAFNPSMRLLTAAGQPVGLIARNDYLRFLPSTAWPANTVEDFFFKAGLVLVGLNLFLANPGRKHQRLLLAGIGGNAAILACTGSFLKLAGATEILGAVSSPNQHFFASFVYYNHWGGFALLGAAAAAGLGLDYHRRSHRGAGQDTPALLLGVLALFILASLPMSGARASSSAGLLLALVLAVRLVPTQGSKWARYRGVAVSAALVLGLVGAMTILFAKDPMRVMFQKTSRQISDLQGGNIADARLVLYRDTWRLFEQQPVFGWGWRSFQYVFPRVQSSEFKMQNEQRLPSVFTDAHNDWLQWLAELGLVGALLGLGALVGVARAASARCWGMSPSFEILAGLGCLGLLACVDFPFACPAIVVTASTLLATAAGIACRRELQVPRSA
jgi:O-antigen ligase